MDLRSLLKSPDPVAAESAPQLAAAASAFVSSPSPDVSQWTAADLERLAHFACHPALPSIYRLPLLQALKFTGKEPHLNPPLYASAHFGPLATCAGLSTDTLPPSNENDPAANEARKVIANLLLLNRPAAITILAFEQCLTPLIALSQSQSLALDSTFLIFRILFLLTASPDHVSTIVAKGTAHFPLHITRLLDTAMEGTPPFTRSACLAEILKTMFNLQSFHPASSPSAPPLFDAAAMQAVARVLTCLPVPVHPYPMSPPLSHAVHVLMCGPPLGWCTPDLARLLCIQVLEPELAHHVFVNDVEPKVGPYTAKMAAAPASSATLANDHVGDRLPPLLHLLAHVVEAEGKRAMGQGESKAVCDTLKELLVPASLDRQVNIEHGRSLGHFLIRLLTHVESSALREAAEVLVFALCDNSASKMVAHTGLGPSAGFLVNRGLLTEDILKAAGHDPKVNPITGQKEDETADLKAEWEKMTDEEKEAEAEKLFVQFERLNKLGIIKAVDPTTGREIGR